ncbi:hypothetical protein GXB85_06085 [Cellulomonas sp. APG4]|uniref:hypothetical protein n=1 Tax=Cellulomonas sp. APG4 TaxID=1538656 RepID=UPI001379AB7D|nr:hypothetical protein [Cellulomonas sp. APG4]NCT90513.1 hypothetical protein [Cellulomonas sp. APG4]
MPESHPLRRSGVDVGLASVASLGHASAAVGREGRADAVVGREAPVRTAVGHDAPVRTAVGHDAPVRTAVRRERRARTAVRRERRVRTAVGYKGRVRTAVGCETRVRTAVGRLVVVLGLLATSGFAWAPGPWRPDAGPAFDAPTAEFRRVMGYAPVPAPGRPDVLTSPHGECSVPTGGTLFGFDEACREHDLAYDLLRFHETHDGAVDPRTRWTADTRFGMRMVERCVDRASELGACLATAGVYTAGVTVNSVRQLYGAPAAESGVQVAVSTLTMIALVVGSTTAVRGLRRMLRGAELDPAAPPVPPVPPVPRSRALGRPTTRPREAFRSRSA